MNSELEVKDLHIYVMDQDLTGPEGTALGLTVHVLFKRHRSTVVIRIPETATEKLYEHLKYFREVNDE